MPDPITSTLPDPQATVDAALGTSSTPTKMDTLPTPPAEPVAPVAPVAPASVAMGDDTPLAFAAPSLNTMPSTPTPTPEAPKVEPMPTSVGSSYLPPVPPAPISTPPVEDKPKKKNILGVVGLVVGLVIVFGLVGATSYQLLTGRPLIAAVKIGPKGPVKDINNAADCSGESNGGWLVWRGDGCAVTGISGSPDNNGDGVGDKDTTDPAITQVENTSNASACSSASGVWCQYGDGFCISNTSTQGCKAVAIEKGIAVSTGAAKIDCGGSQGAVAQKCSCGSNKEYCFDTTGYCGGEANLASETRLAGLCAITPDPLFVPDPACTEVDKLKCKSVPAGTAGTPDFTKDGLADWFQTIGLTYTGTEVSYYCEGQTGDTSVGCSTPGFPVNPNCFCGTIQVDNASGFKSKTMKCGCGGATANETSLSHKACNTTTKVCETVAGAGADTCATDANCVTTTTPTLVCTGLTQTPSTIPVVGEKVTFTCAGTITPTGAAALSYKFKYSLDGGADQLLVNKTDTTAELSIASCGTYSVQCKVCATISGVLTCDPVWTGAVQ